MAKMPRSLTRDEFEALDYEAVRCTSCTPCCMSHVHFLYEGDVLWACQGKLQARNDAGKGQEALEGLEGRIKRKGAELGFADVGFAAVRDYPEYLEDACSRPNYEPFTDGDDALIRRLSQTKTRHPWAQSIVCATLGYSAIDYPEALSASVARVYQARVYSPQPGTVHGFQMEALASFLEELGLRVERNQFCVPQRIACAEAGIVTLGNNNFAYGRRDGSFLVLATFLVDAKLEPTGGKVVNGCPEGCTLCQEACPTGAITGPRQLDLGRCILFNNQRFAPGAQQDIWEVMGERIHGCDECQLACPRNRRALERAAVRDPFLEALAGEFDLEKVLLLDDDYYERVIRPIMYNYISDLDIFRRNAAVALGNSGDVAHLPALRKAREECGNPEVLKAIDWAIDRLSA